MLFQDGNFNDEDGRGIQDNDKESARVGRPRAELIVAGYFDEVHLDELFAVSGCIFPACTSW